MKEIHDKLEELGRTFEEFKKENNQRLKQVEAKGTADPILVEKIEKTNAGMDSLEKQIEQIKTAMARPSTVSNPENEAKEKQIAHTKAINDYLRSGEFKAMSSDDNPNGGMLLSPERSSEVVKKVFESSPIRSLASVQQMSSDTMEVLNDLDEAASGWVGENGSRSETNTPALSMAVISMHELYSMPKATQKMLDDASFDLEAWLAAKVAEKFSRDEASGFVSGNGIKKPRGILSYSAGSTFGTVEQVNSGSAATITANGLINLQVALKEPYQSNASWLMKRATVGVARTLVDGTGSYLWQPGLQLGVPGLLLGRPVYFADDMAALGSNALSVAYGDIRAGYQIIEKLGIRVLRDNLTSKGNILFYTTKRVGGGMKNFEAIKIGKCSA